MIKRTIHTLMALMVLSGLLVSCNDNEWQGMPDAPREGYVALRFNADIPEMQEVITRSVDLDGGGVQDMTLFCFDSYGLFITTAEATITSTGELTGTFDAQVPENTRTIHFLANQNMTDFEEDNFRNKSEAEVMAVLEGSSGRMIYWARFACNPDNTATIDAQLNTAGNSIELIRNHALVSIDNPTAADNRAIEVTGFVVYNTNAFGTVAPYHPETGFDFEWPGTDPFITLPKNTAKMSDITDVTTATGQYVFECENGADDPVSVIVRGHLPGQTLNDDLYYRVLLIDEEGEQIPLRRNHHYKLHIAGALSYGQTTFAKAVEAAATNNVWISISDEVNEVEDQSYILTVEKTFYVLPESVTDNTYTLTYTLKGKNGTTIQDTNEPTVTWIDNHVARNNIGKVFDVVSGVGEGQIQINLLALGNNQKLEGTLLVKKGRLQRKIKVITIKEQSFAPTWVGTQVYGDVDDTNPTLNRPHVTTMFTIPETCPEELFPMEVLISVNHLDVRSESGMELPVIREGDEGYGDPNGIGFKYVYTATEPGVQRVYFENILNQTDDTKRTLRIEADYFKNMDQIFTFSANQKSITVEGLNSYTAEESGSGEFAEDELIYYRLVPQKKNANVQFDLQLLEKTSEDGDAQTGTPFNADAMDEFLLYSQYLDYYTDDQTGVAGVSEFDCKFYPEESATWWQANNLNGGRMLMFKPRKPTAPTAGTGRYSIYMHTNRAKSAEVVRIASNLQDNPPVLSSDADGNGSYGGNSYRSVTFELANYNPFRFAARVNGSGTDATGDAEEAVDPLSWTYKPDQPVDIELEITSFEGSDGKSADPFGEEFEIYIDAPMLSIDESRLAECKLDGDKLKAHPTIPGRFVYTVAANREAERAYGSGETVIKTDNTLGGVNQTNERKKLPFKTSSIVSAGDIRISSDEEMVVFFAKTFKVSNKSIKGSLQYQTTDGVVNNVLKDAFVSFELTRNNSRIGAITVTADGQYELRLRKEYEFNWYDEVVLNYEDGQGNAYQATYTSLADLFGQTGNTDIMLKQQTGGGN